MIRYILVNDGVVSEDLRGVDFSSPEILDKVFRQGVEDVVGAYNVGDLYSDDAYALSTESVFSPLMLPNRNAFTLAGVPVNTNPSVKSNYVYTLRDSEVVFNFITAYGAYHGVKTPNYTLTDKATAQQAFDAAEFTLLKTVTVSNRADIESFPHEKIILKPSVSCGGRAPKHPLSGALYTIKTKTETLSVLDGLNAFSDPTVLSSNPIIVQQVADGDGENFEALILSGVVNGSGNVWHLAPIELSTQYNDIGRNAETVWSPENNNVETTQLQQCVERLLAANKSVNCFYQLQFLRCNGSWVPHDFQFRMTYYVDFCLEELGFIQYKADIIKFAFDRSLQMPEQPRSFGLKLRTPKVGVESKKFVDGGTKAEVLSKLGAL